MNERVVIVGGGLAGLAAAAALASRGLAITLLESRPRWGGRASSFVDHTTGEPIDNCQHVALGCCTNFLHFCQSVGIEGSFRREERLTFVAPDGTFSDFAAAPLPAPLHLFPTFARLGFLSWPEKWRLALGLKALAQVDPATCGDETFLEWLKRHRQPPAVIERFWHVVLVSALSETLDRIDVGHARKVFVDSFLRNRSGWEVWLPVVPLDDLYETIVERGLAARGVTCRLQAGVRRIVDCGSWIVDRTDTTDPGYKVSAVELRSGEVVEVEQVVLAVPQFVVRDLLPDAWRALAPFAEIDRLETAPISSVHLWFDRPITELRHATFVDRVSQWLFNRSAIQSGVLKKGDRHWPAPVPVFEPGHADSAHVESSPADNSHYYQIVISASRDVIERPQAETIQTVVEELAAIWPVVRDARLLHSRLVTEHKAVVSMLPGVDRWRPAQQTPIANLHLAGDWTQTGWPGTMEGAVRSGYLAAESVLRRLGRPEALVQPDLPTALLSRILLGL